ncbi:MAG: hypothetical protein ACXWDO_00330 [Bacteroidia bacterium]
MKTLKQLALFLLVGSSAFLTSCGSDDPDPINAPTVSVASSKATAAPGETVTLTITAAAEEGLDNLKLTLSTNGVTPGTILDTTFKSRNSAQITYSFLVAGNNNDKHTFVATVKDKKGVAATSQTTVTVNGTGATDVQLCSGVRLGAQSSATGSSFNSGNCAVYTVSQAKANAADVDFLYFYGATNQATLAAPNDEAADDFSSFDLANWSTRNATKLKKLSGFDFNTASAASIQSAYGTGGDSKANMLAVGDMIGFMTADGKYGVARVNAIVGGGNGTVLLDVKTQK